MSRLNLKNLYDQGLSVREAIGRAETRNDDHRVIGGVQIQPTAEQIKNTLGLRFA